jgi:uncharacterized integral membrane protein
LESSGQFSRNYYFALKIFRSKKFGGLSQDSAVNFLLIRAIVATKSYCRWIMRYMMWFLRAVLFLILLGFAMKNDQIVVLHYFFGYEWQTSLILILLLFFAVGVSVGVLAVLGNIFRQRREISTLKRELRLKNKLANVNDINPDIP